MTWVEQPPRAAIHTATDIALSAFEVKLLHPREGCYTPAYPFIRALQVTRVPQILAAQTVGFTLVPVQGQCNNNGLGSRLSSSYSSQTVQRPIPTTRAAPLPSVPPVREGTKCARPSIEVS